MHARPPGCISPGGLFPFQSASCLRVFRVPFGRIRVQLSEFRAFAFSNPVLLGKSEAIKRTSTRGERAGKANLSLIARGTAAHVAVVWMAAAGGLIGCRLSPAIERKDPMPYVPPETAALLLVEQPDARLLRLAAECGGTVVTNDFLAKNEIELPE